MSWQIAIDGPAGAGKSTIAKCVAAKLNFEYIDTGAMYRAVTLKALRMNINLENEEEFKFLMDTSIDFRNQTIYLDEEDVSEEIRSLDVTNNVSLVSKHAFVRKHLVAIQRKLANHKNVIMDGRDIGSVVLPDANLKVFLVASVEERASRRLKERLEKKQQTSNLQDTMEEIISRDYKDSHRDISPLVKTRDAIEIDSSKLCVQTVVDTIISLVIERGYKMENLEQKNDVVETSEKVETAEQDQAEVVEKPKRKRTTKKAVEPTPSEQPATEETGKEDAVVEVVAVEEPAEEASVEETVEEKSEEAPVVKPVALEEEEDEVSENDEDVDSSEDVQEVEEEVSEEVEPSVLYKELQMVEGNVVRVIEARKEEKKGNKLFKAKEERVLIRLDDGQEGFLFRRDTADIKDEEDLFDLFVEGDRVQVVIKKIYPDGGKFIFSTALLKMRSDISKFEEVIKDHGILTAKVTKCIKVGLLLKYEDFSCLLPSSQINLTEEECAELVGKEIDVTPIRIDYGRIRLIVSHTVATAIRKRADKEEFLSQVEVGQVYEGVVKNIENYGAFIEIIKGVEGLLHISEIDHNRVYKIDKILKTGDTVSVKVIKVDKDHIGLSRKALLPNYWQDYTEGKSVGDVIKATVLELNNAGVVVKLTDDITGFLPKSEFAWERDVYLEDFIAVGDEIDVKVIEIDPSKKRIIFSRKQLSENPWDKINYKIGDVVMVTVSKKLPDGFKIDLEGASGYLSKGSIRTNEIDSIQEGDQVKVKIRVFNKTNTRLVVSKRDAEEVHQKENINKYMKSQEKMSNTFGDLIGDKLNKMKK